jgi:general secretion pathway protein G
MLSSQIKPLYGLHESTPTGAGRQTGYCGGTGAAEGTAGTTRRNGFTLIEILIVVVILGILAAIVMPQFTSASTQGRRNTLLAVVQTLRTQVALYKLQHGDTLPDLTANGGNNWTLLTQTSTYFGQQVGPYMQTVPTSPVNSRSNVVDGSGTAPASVPCGYIYDYNGGNGTGAVWGTDIDGVTIVPQ